MRIIFMGTPDFAIPSLEILLEHGYEIAAVVTSPDRPAGRGRKLSISPVKQFAQEHGLPVLQPEKLKDETFLKRLKGLNADLQVVVAFRMLPEIVWDMPPRGTVNLHASLLPQYRGAAPINWVIINDEKETGLTTFFIDHKIDTGKIIYQEKIKIGPEDTAGDLHDKMMISGAQLILKTVNDIRDNNFPEKEQPLTGDFKMAPKLFKPYCRIDWSNDIDEVYNFIRGLSPYPCAWTNWNDKVFKVYKAGKKKERHNEKPGKVISDQKTFLHISVREGYLDLHEIQLEGKKKMKVNEFLRGMDDLPDSLV